MRYQNKSSISYMFRNFLGLVYVSLPAALVAAFAAYMYKPTSEIRLFLHLVKGNLTMENYLSEMLGGVSLLRYGRYWWIFIIALAVIALSAALLLVKVDRHMRTGQMPTLPMRRAFGIYPQVLLYVVCFVVLYEIGALVTVGVSSLIKFIGNATVIVSLSLVLSLLLRMVGSYMFGLLIISFPLKYSENYRFNRAMSYSARIMFRKKRALRGVALVYPLARIAVLGAAYLLEGYSLDIVVYAVALLFAITYVPCLAYKQYYDEVGGERRDIGKIMFG